MRQFLLQPPQGLHYKCAASAKCYDTSVPSLPHSPSHSAREKHERPPHTMFVRTSLFQRTARPSCLRLLQQENKKRNTRKSSSDRGEEITLPDQEWGNNCIYSPPLPQPSQRVPYLERAPKGCSDTAEGITRHSGEVFFFQLPSPQSRQV